MHDHGKNDDGMKGMVWMMIICCAVPLLFIFVLGAGGAAAGGPSWLIIGGVVVMLFAHFFMMGKSHTPHRPSDEEKNDGEKVTAIEEDKGEKKKDGSGHGCCH